MSGKTEAEPGNAQAENGIVIIDGPDAVALSMTPRAAETMGKRMIDAAQIALRQREQLRQRTSGRLDHPKA